MINYHELQIVQTAKILKILGHEGRLAILCNLVDTAQTANQLIDKTGLSQSNLSQHLNKMRDHGVLHCNRNGHYLYYSIKETKLLELIKTLQKIYC